MHLPNGEHTVRFGGISEERVEKKVYSNGTLDTQENGTHTNGNAPTNSGVSDLNEVDIHVPTNLPLDSVLDVVLTAWTVLIQRYQRDVFHHFTWGAKDSGKDKIQCISTGDLDLPSHQTAASLTKKLGNLRLRDISVEQGTIFLNDGTPEEV